MGGFALANRPVPLLELASEGRLELALARLAIERDEIRAAGRDAAALTFPLTENWPGLGNGAARYFRNRESMPSSRSIFALWAKSARWMILSCCWPRVLKRASHA